MQKQTYGLLTAIAMIVGVVIGSGIYFRADNILLFTGGSFPLGMLALTLAAGTIIFGSLSLSELAQRNTNSGGIASYFEHYYHPSIAAAFGFFQAFVYYPTVVAVVAWVGGIYTGSFLGISATLEMQTIIAAFYILLFALMNYYSRKLGGLFQSVSTIVKIIPLILIATIGIFWQKSTPPLPTHIVPVTTYNVGWGWLAALVPLAFSYDGWTAVINIAPEIKHPEKNLVRALIIGPLFILLTYLAFFYGLNQLLGAEFIMAVGDDAITYALIQLFGTRIGNALLLIVIISILGVVNGMILANMRLPQAFASRNWLHSKRLATINPTYQLSNASALLTTFITILWLLVHYIVQKFDLLAGRDVSEISIVFNNLGYAVLYVKVLQLYFHKQITNRLTGLFAPLLGIVGALILLIGSLQAAPLYVILFQLFCLVIASIGYVFYHKALKQSGV